MHTPHFLALNASRAIMAIVIKDPLINPRLGIALKNVAALFDVGQILFCGAVRAHGSNRA